MDEKEIKELMENTPPEERAAAWEEYVRAEVNSLLDTFLPEAVSGNVGVRYDYPVLGVDPKTDKQMIDKTKAKGVLMSIVFEFAEPIQFFAEPSEDSE